VPISIIRPKNLCLIADISGSDTQVETIPSAKGDGETFSREVTERFGVLPNFFCSASAAPGLIDRLWDFAKSAYLDSPLPSLFKERLFV
jgi:hypothetical protein